VEEARNKNDSAVARKLKLTRWERSLYATVEGFLSQFSLMFRGSLENLLGEISPAFAQHSERA
jgi:hypothetical protein